MSKLKLISVVGARPNFMKIAPIIKETDLDPNIENILVHTGQHYDNLMSETFFRDLNIRPPNINLEVGSGSHAEQTARVMLAFEPVITTHKPDWVIVVGDVNSTIACTLVASKLGIRVAHVEAGLRSFDRSMPEEINRLVTDVLADLLLTPSQDADENLLREGISPTKIKQVGNVMIDSLYANIEKSKSSNILEKLNLESNQFAVLTLHRPSNVDDEPTIKKILNALEQIQHKIKIVFPLHPRTKLSFEKLGLMKQISDWSNLILCEPLGYLDFLKLWSNSKLVLTDSGGLQEETTALGVNCLTLRENTERPITVSCGTNKIVGTDTLTIVKAVESILDTKSFPKRIPDLWDGETSKRIVKLLKEFL